MPNNCCTGSYYQEIQWEVRHSLFEPSDNNQHQVLAGSNFRTIIKWSICKSLRLFELHFLGRFKRLLAVLSYN